MDKADIQAKLEEAKHTGSLNLSGNHLSDADLAAVAAGIAGWEDRIVQLSMGACRLTIFPDFIERCTALQMLFLYDNEISVVPVTWQNFSKLTVFDISGNPVKGLPGIEHSTVQRLYVNRTQVKNIHSAWKEMKTLRVFEWDLLQFGDGNIGVENLPASLRELKITHGLLGNNVPVAHLPELESLVLAQNGLTGIGDETEQLSKLNLLDLSGNMLQVLPADIGSLSSLAYLDVSDNMLETLPESAGQLPLQTAFFRNNKLQKMPASVNGWSSLSMLDLGHNALDRLPDYSAQLPALDTIDCSYNQFTAIPGWLEKIASLYRVVFAGNPLLALPLWLGNGDRHVDVSNTRIDAGAVNALITHGISDSLILTIAGTPAAMQKDKIASHPKLDIII